MATQRITVARIGGQAGERIVGQFRQWAAARDMHDPQLWSNEQWLPAIRREADEFAVKLRLHGAHLPVIHFCEWVDHWSMGDLFPRLVTGTADASPLGVHADQFEIWCHCLPDGGALADRLAARNQPNNDEERWFATRLLEAVRAWETLVPNAALVVVREVLGGSILDREVCASLTVIPEWMTRLFGNRL